MARPVLPHVESGKCDVEHGKAAEQIGEATLGYEGVSGVFKRARAKLQRVAKVSGVDVGLGRWRAVGIAPEGGFDPVPRGDETTAHVAEELAIWLGGVCDTRAQFGACRRERKLVS